MPLTKIDTKMMGSGAVLQVVTGSLSVNTTLTSVFANTGLQATITPSSTNSKIVVIVTQPFAIVSSSGQANAWGSIGVYRDNTTIFEPRKTTDGGTQFGVDGLPLGIHQFRGVFSATITDAPNSTSPITYLTKASALVTSITTPGSELTQTSAHITLIEIAG